ncbi:MAG: ribokinase [Dehalococcoidia bacterium]|nr:ribokinase [Dehalococcoidia bacterium]
MEIAVLGSCTMDLVFRMPRMPAAGETLFADHCELLPGGKGLNQAIAVTRLGATARLIGRVGDDVFGRELCQALRADGVDTAHVAVVPGAKSGIAAPVVTPGGDNRIFAAPGANLEVDLAQIEAARHAIEGARALLLQFEAPMEANLAAARIARAAGARVILNAAPIVPHPPELLALADVLVVNEVEAAMLAPGHDSDLERARALLDRGPGTIIVTTGPDGAIAATAEGIVAVPAFAVTPVDTVGAGDAFCGALTVALSEGQPLEDALRFANVAAAISVTRAGAAPALARREEVVELLARRVD